VPASGAVAGYTPPPPPLDLASMPLVPPAAPGSANEFPNGVQPPTAAPAGLAPVAPSPLPPVSPTKGF
jgi:hypothetical protein